MISMEKEKNWLINCNSQMKEELNKIQENSKNQRESLIQDYELRVSGLEEKNHELIKVKKS